MPAYDAKLEYITGQLKRARNKRFESYVINRLWGLVCDLPLQPRTQMYARVDDNGETRRRFVDFCFPEVGIAVEVDEGQHASSLEFDRMREEQISASDILDGLYAGQLRFERVQVYDRSFFEIDERIKAIAAIIRKAAAGISAEGIWLFLDPEAWCKENDVIRASNPVRFRTMAQACNCVLGTTYKGLQLGYFTPRIFRGTERHNWKVWAPHLAVGGQAATKSGFRNFIEPETGIITEYYPEEYDTPEIEDLSGEPTRIVFIQEVDKLTRASSYRFAGIYQNTKRDGRRAVYERSSDTLQLPPNFSNK